MENGQRTSSYVSGRIHEVYMTGKFYVVERLIDVKNNVKKVENLQYHKMRELVVVYSAWCSKCWIAVV